MYKKISLLKNVLKVIILGFVIFNMLKSCSMAYTFEQFKQFLNACYEEDITTNAMTKNDLKYAIDNLYKIENLINQNNIDTTEYVSYAIRGYGGTNLTANNYMEIWFFRSVHWSGAENNGTTGKFGLETPNATTIYFQSNASSTEMKYASQRVWYEHFCCGIFQTLPPGMTEDSFKNCLTQFKWNPDDHPLTPPFNFIPYNIDFIDDHNILKFSYVGNIALGELGENDYYLLEARLKDSSLTTLGTALWNENQECYYRDNALIVENNTRILANTIYLNYYQPYYLEFTIYSDSTNYEIQGHLYKFYPMNAVIENGQIVSPGSGDYTNQNQTIDIIGGVVGELPSGDSPGSGILGGIASLFIPSSDFFLTYFNNLNNWLTNHLGFIYTPFEIVINLFQRILTIDYSNPHVEIGPYTLPLNEDFELVPKITYYFNDLLENQKFKDVYDIYLVIVDGIIYTGFVYLCYCKYEEIIGGNKQ